jgi:alkaline phosphatase D
MLHHPMSTHAAIDRRTLLQRAMQLALSGFTGALAGCASTPVPARFEADPFTLGVASGFPDAHSVVLWTRLASDPRRPDGGLPPQPVEVRWELAADEAFTQVTRTGTVLAQPERAHTVHVEVDGLAPERWYWYRFTAGRGDSSARSPVGRTRTAPAQGSLAQRLRFAACSCQHYEYGHFGALRHLADEAPDLVVHLGDYIYESDARAGTAVRRHWTAEPTTLEGYRVRWAQYKTDPDLQRAHAAAPWLYTWDDHEVDNDYAADLPQDLASGFIARRAAAYRACFEHMPLRALAAPARDGGMRMYGSWTFGALAEFHLLDLRQYRSAQGCPRPGAAGSNTVSACAAFADPARTLLGLDQERWLDDQLARSRTRWTLIGQQTLLAHADSQPGPGELIWTDGWSGYPVARDRLVASLARPSVRNPVVLGGDVHAHYVCDIGRDARDPGSPLVATELCSTSLTSPSLAQPRIDGIRGENPRILLADGRRRGYLSVEVAPQRLQAALRVIDDPRQPQPRVSTLARFAVEDGRPGARPD